ncbi:45628_t:CDS:2 [Gigaspora margarita]|uniref:45628_t:CDS:1 n=1 Tax=Gigaspora margarita TaxID=4874 RepID=A0ABM8W3W0_GIGMA|nr:45628_t:CDS:2 [Gigaspora margarita]
MTRSFIIPDLFKNNDTEGSNNNDTESLTKVPKQSTSCFSKTISRKELVQSLY